MNRKFLFLIGLCLSVWSLRADDRGRSLVRDLARTIASYKSYEVTFTVRMEGEFGSIPGRIVVSGDRYYVAVNDAEVFCNGKQIYTFNDNEDEVTIEEPDPADNSLLSNPSRFFRLDDNDFEMTYNGSAQVAGKTVEQVELTPKAEGAGYHSILLKIDAATGLPSGVDYRTDGTSAPVEIAIGKLTPDVAVSDATFTFDRSKHKGVEVIDLR